MVKINILLPKSFTTFRVFEISQSARSVELIFEQSGAILHGPSKSFRVDNIWYKPQQHIASVITGFHILHHSYFPDSAFIINAKSEQQSTSQLTSTLNRQQQIAPPRATADKGFELQLDKFQSAGLAADPTKFELVGNEYMLKDFRLRVGTVTFGPTVKGTIVELEFAPSNIVMQCQSLLHELMDIFFPGHSQKAPEIFQRQALQPDNYHAIDTAQQYLDIFQTMRKRS